MKNLTLKQFGGSIIFCLLLLLIKKFLKVIECMTSGLIFWIKQNQERHLNPINLLFDAYSNVEKGISTNSQLTDV